MKLDRLIDMIQGHEMIYLVFDFFELDLRRYMDKVKRPGLTAGHIKVKIKIIFFFNTHFISFVCKCNSLNTKKKS